MASVIFTLILVSLPGRWTRISIWQKNRQFQNRVRISVVTSLGMFVLLCVLIYVGFFGSHDPLKNPLPLYIWTIWWIVLVILQAALGNIWRYINPWTGAYFLIRKFPLSSPVLKFPRNIGRLPGTLLFIGFAVFLIADPSPADPDRLAMIVLSYLTVTLTGMILFGKADWIAHCEFVTIFMQKISLLSPIYLGRNQIRVGVPGWQIVQSREARFWSTVFLFAMLASGSFEGLNVTFLWLDAFGINPLEHPGRSELFWLNVVGLVAAIFVVTLLFAAAIFAGLLLIGETHRLFEAIGRQALCLIPIIAGFHFAHYLTAFMVEIQYALAAANDPFANGANYLGIQPFYVTTGFFNSRQTVNLIWLTQAGAVVIAHIAAILLSHAVSTDMFPRRKTALLNQIPISIFMVFYTFFGLWLLASPRAA